MMNMVALFYDCLEATAQGKLILCHQIHVGLPLVLRIVAAIPNIKFDSSIAIVEYQMVLLF